MLHANQGNFEPFDATDYRVGIVVSQFNQHITGALLDSAESLLKQYSVHQSHTTVIKVSGAVEIPVLLQRLARKHQYSCLVALGAVIRGETTHYEYVCNMVSEGILHVQLDFRVPIGFGVLTCENEQQALARLEMGAGATAAALHSARIIRELDTAAD